MFSFHQDEKFSHIEKADIEKVERCLKEKEEWRDKKQNAQNQIPLTKDPVVLASQVRTELQVSGLDGGSMVRVTGEGRKMVRGIADVPTTAC